MNVFERLGPVNNGFCIRIAGVSFLLAATIMGVSGLPASVPVWAFWLIAGAFLFFSAHICWLEIPAAHRAPVGFERQLSGLKETISHQTSTLHSSITQSGAQLNAELIEQIDCVCAELLEIVECIESEHNQKVTVDA